MAWAAGWRRRRGAARGAVCWWAPCWARPTPCSSSPRRPPTPRRRRRARSRPPPRAPSWTWLGSPSTRARWPGSSQVRQPAPTCDLSPTPTPTCDLSPPPPATCPHSHLSPGGLSVLGYFLARPDTFLAAHDSKLRALLREAAALEAAGPGDLILLQSAMAAKVSCLGQCRGSLLAGWFLHRHLFLV